MVPSMFWRTTAGSMAWNSNALPSPAISTPASANLWRTSARSAALNSTSTPCEWVVRSSTPENPVAVHMRMIVGTSHSAAI